jgi:hypothetical protein
VSEALQRNSLFLLAKAGLLDGLEATTFRRQYHTMNQVVTISGKSPAEVVSAIEYHRAGREPGFEDCGNHDGASESQLVREQDQLRGAPRCMPVRRACSVVCFGGAGLVPVRDVPAVGGAG